MRDKLQEIPLCDLQLFFVFQRLLGGSSAVLGSSWSSKNVGLSVRLPFVLNERLPTAVEDWITCSLLVWVRVPKSYQVLLPFVCREMKTWKSPLSRQLCGDLSFLIFQISQLQLLLMNKVHASVHPLAESARCAQESLSTSNCSRPVQTWLSLLPCQQCYGGLRTTRQTHTSLVSASWVTSSPPTYFDSASRQLQIEATKLSLTVLESFVDNVMRRPAPDHRPPSSNSMHLVDFSTRNQTCCNLFWDILLREPENIISVLICSHTGQRQTEGYRSRKEGSTQIVHHYERDHLYHWHRLG